MKNTIREYSSYLYIIHEKSLPGEVSRLEVVAGGYTYPVILQCDSRRGEVTLSPGTTIAV